MPCCSGGNNSLSWWNWMCRGSREVMARTGRGKGSEISFDLWERDLMMEWGVAKHFGWLTIDSHLSLLWVWLSNCYTRLWIIVATTSELPIIYCTNKNGKVWDSLWIFSISTQDNKSPNRSAAVWYLCTNRNFILLTIILLMWQRNRFQSLEIQWLRLPILTIYY